MRAEVLDGGTIQVTLSRRNLLVLLAKLDGNPRDSLCTIAAPKIYGKVIVTAEEDDEHYAHPSRHGADPGLMHPDTEATIHE